MENAQQLKSAARSNGASIARAGSIVFEQYRKDYVESASDQTRRRRIFLLLSLAIASIDAIFITVNYQFTQQAYLQEFQKERATYQQAFEAQMENTTGNLLFIATLFANKPEVQQLFLQGKKAVAREGGGTGGEHAAIIRQQLYELVSPEWNKAISRLNARQLHFHLAPGSLSFLRVHQPEKFGDSMHQLRHIIVDTNADTQPRTGFETGRVYSGLRGVTAVLATDPDSGKQVHVGALEAGTSFHTTLEVLDRKFGVGTAVFLSEKHIASTVWPEFLDRRKHQSTAQCQCIYEDSSRENALQLVKHLVVQTGNLATGPDVRLTDIDGKKHVFYILPIRDYQGHQHPARENVGSGIFWRDISEEWSTYKQEQNFNIIYGVLAFIVVEILLFAGFRVTTRHLQNKIATATKAVNQQNRLITALLENNDNAYISFDKENRVTYLNRAAEKIWRLKRTQSLGTDFWDLLPEMASYFYKTFQQARKRQKLTRSDGYYPPLNKHFALSVYPWNGGFWAFFQDITETKQKEGELHRQATTDALTGLCNRNRFAQILKAELSRAERYDRAFALLLLDIDLFKQVNDKHGHSAGDDVLIEFSRRVQSHLRGADSMARWGGEEFVVLLPETGLSGARTKAEAIRQTIAKQIFSHGEQITVSIGLTTRCQGDTPDALFKRADQYLYEAKNNGRNRIEYGATSATLTTQAPLPSNTVTGIRN